MVNGFFGICFLLSYINSSSGNSCSNPGLVFYNSGFFLGNGEEFLSKYSRLSKIGAAFAPKIMEQVPFLLLLHYTSTSWALFLLEYQVDVDSEYSDCKLTRLL